MDSSRSAGVRIVEIFVIGNGNLRVRFFSVDPSNDGTVVVFELSIIFNAMFSFLKFVIEQFV